ncbi:MFS transporter [Micromonospora andamanensis]|uniref:MFS transporter n=1 Tax=Micromonospora andamanensis TaxID=1287068 RepID=A0ABQ4I1Q4_9ACTN|nr:MFS transporter [Micromonospora andamanensis]GIJ11805.1 MFS transporter [Micromonospora andamanensis]
MSQDRGADSLLSDPPPPDRPPEVAASLWRHPDFLRLWGAQTIAMLGSRVTELALPLTAILLLDAGPTSLGLLNVAEYLPFTLVTLFAGVLADRYRRRGLLIGANIGRALILAVVPVLALTDQLSMTALYVVAFLIGVLTSQFDVAYQAYVPVLVSRAQLVEANSKLQSTRSIAETGGKGFSGVLIQVFTAPGAIIVDCLTYLISAASLLAIKTREPRRSTTSRGFRGVWSEIGEGLRATLGHRILRAVLLQAAWFNLFHDVVLVLFPLYGLKDLELSPALLGFIIASASVGAFGGSLIAGGLARRLGIGPAMVAGVLTSALGLLALPLATGSPMVQLLLLGAGYVISGVGITIFNIHSVALRQAIIPNRLLGRVSGTYRFVAWAVIPLGGLLAGVLANVLSARGALLIAGIGLMVGAVVFAFTPAGRIAEAPEGPEAELPTNLKRSGDPM